MGILKRRYLYLLLVGVPGLIAAFLISLVVYGSAVGVLWIFVFGDNPWPAFIENALPVFFAVVFLTVWLASLAVGFVIGKRLEQNPTLNKKHVLTSIGVTILGILFIVFYQVSIGNIGPKSDSARCGDFCSQRGYFASSVSLQAPGDGTCSCLDHSGLEIIKVPLSSLDRVK